MIPLRQHGKRWLVMLAILSSGCSSPQDESARVLEEALNAGRSKCQAPLGERLVIAGGWPGKRPETSLYEGHLKDLRSFEKAGLLIVTSTETLDSSKPFRWDDWFARTQRGETAKVTATPTELGLATGTVEEWVDAYPSGEWLVTRCRSFEVERIVTDEEISKEATRYRLVEAVVRQERNETWQQIYGDDDPIDHPLANDRFAIRQLLRYNAFEDRWKPFRGANFGTPDGVFRSDSVGAFLKGE